MRKYNDGIGEANILHNQFTSYLVMAVHRKKIQYLQAKFRQLNNEIALDIQEGRKEFQSDPDMTGRLPFLEQLENKNLHQAIERLKKRELRILTMRVLEERSFQDIADETGIGYKTVASIYYRVIKKLRNDMGGDID